MINESYIATIRRDDKRSWIFHRVPVDIASWQLQYFSEDDISRARKTGIHDFLNFQGKIVLSSIADDDELVKWHQRGSDWYLDAVRELNPDYYLTTDTYVYLDAPRWERKYQLDLALANIDRAVASCMDPIPIPLVKAGKIDDIEATLEYIQGYGLAMAAFHTHGFLGREKRFIDCFYRTAEDCHVRPIIFGMGSPVFLKRYRCPTVGYKHFLWACFGNLWRSNDTMMEQRDGRRVFSRYLEEWIDSEDTLAIASSNYLALLDYCRELTNRTSLFDFNDGGRGLGRRTTITR